MLKSGGFHCPKKNKKKKKFVGYIYLFLELSLSSKNLGPYVKVVSSNIDYIFLSTYGYEWKDV